MSIKTYTYHRVFDGYNFLSVAGTMEEIVGTDMELVSKDDHDVALRRAKAEGLKEAEQYALNCVKELQSKIQDIELGRYTLAGSQTKEGVAEWVHAKTLQAGRMAKWITARIAEVEADARAAQIEEGEDK